MAFKSAPPSVTSRAQSITPPPPWLWSPTTEQQQGRDGLKGGGPEPVVVDYNLAHIQQQDQGADYKLLYVFSLLSVANLSC